MKRPTGRMEGRELGYRSICWKHFRGAIVLRSEGTAQIHSPSREKGCWDTSTHGWAACDRPSVRGFEIFDPSPRPPISVACVFSCWCVFQASLLLESRTGCKKGLEPSRKWYCWRGCKQKLLNQTDSVKCRLCHGLCDFQASYWTPSFDVLNHEMGIIIVSRSQGCFKDKMR